MNNRIFSHTVSLLLVMGASAQQQAPLAAAQWATQQQDALATITEAAFAETLEQGVPALEKLFAEVKTGYASDAVALTRIAALTQHVMHPAGATSRSAYADALLDAARRAADADVTCFFLDQLRWCGLPKQAEALKVFEQSDKPGVAELASITRQAVTDDRTSKAAPPPPTRYAAFNTDLARLDNKALTDRLLQALDDPDTAIAGVALSHARTAGGKKETARWTAKLASVTDPARKAMLLDMLGERGDTRACDAVAACLTASDDDVAAAAQRALIRLDASAFAAEVPPLLKNLPPVRQTLARDGIRQLKTGLVKTALIKPYNTFSDTGKKVALEVLKERRIADAVPIGLAALDAKDDETVIAGYRLLREIAGGDLAETLVVKALATTGRVTPEAQSTLAAAARRDTSDAYKKALSQALAAAPDTQKPIALDTASRLGGEDLLTSVETAAGSANAEISTAAVRALAAWSDAGSLPALLRLAVTAPDAKRRTLAVRGVSKLFNTFAPDKKALLTVWRTLRNQSTSEENKKTIDDLFKDLCDVTENQRGPAPAVQSPDP